MKTRYRVIARRKIEGNRLLRLRPGRNRALEPRLDDPIEMPSEMIDIATGELVTPNKKDSRD